MLNETTKLFEDEFSEAEYLSVRTHQKTTDNPEINWTKMSEAWRDESGTLCVRYADGNWWHYSEKGTWW
jgi:hypothetical protein